MLSAAHTIISLPFGIFLQNPLIIFISAFIFHLILDSIYHWNIYPYKFKHFPVFRVGIDVLGGVIIAWLLVKNNFFSWPILAAILGGNMPDIIHGLWDITGRSEQRRPLSWFTSFFKFHNKIQWETTNPTTCLIPQIILILIAIFLIK